MEGYGTYLKNKARSNHRDFKYLVNRLQAINPNKAARKDTEYDYYIYKLANEAFEDWNHKSNDRLRNGATEMANDYWKEYVYTMVFDMDDTTFRMYLEATGYYNDEIDF